jgi:hypothetical protein
MTSVSMTHVIGTIASLSMLMIILFASTNYVSVMTQSVIVSQLEEVATRVSTDIVDLTILALSSKSESFVVQKTINITGTVNDRAYSIFLGKSDDGFWKVRAKLDLQPTVLGEATLTWTTNSSLINIVEGGVPVGNAIVAICEKTTVSGTPYLRIRLEQQSPGG